MPWLLFGSAGFDEAPQPGAPPPAVFKRSAAALDVHVKSFVRPMAAAGPRDPHRYHLTPPWSSCWPDGTEAEAQTPWAVRDPEDAPAFVAHYAFQDYATYVRRKVLRPRDDTGDFRPPLRRAVLHSLYNDTPRSLACFALLESDAAEARAAAQTPRPEGLEAGGLAAFGEAHGVPGVEEPPARLAAEVHGGLAQAPA